MAQAVWINCSDYRITVDSEVGTFQLVVETAGHGQFVLNADPDTPKGRLFGEALAVLADAWSSRAFQIQGAGNDITAIRKTPAAAAAPAPAAAPGVATPPPAAPALGTMIVSTDEVVGAPGEPPPECGESS